MKGIPQVSISLPKPSLGAAGRFRWTALGAFVATTVAFALSAVLLAAGTSTKIGSRHFWLLVNTTNTGQDLIQISTATDGATGDIVNLPVIGDLLGDVLDGVNEAIDQGVQDLQGQILSNLTDLLGIKDVYTFFLSGICEGKFVDPEDPNSDIDLESCYGYGDNRGLRNISRSIPSSFVIGTANVSVPLVAVLGESLTNIVDLAGTGSKFMFTLILIGAITTGIMLFASLAFFVARFPRVVVLVGALLSGLGSTALVIVAGAGTGIIFGSSSAGGPISSALGTEVKKGIAFVVIVWIAAAFAFIGALYWFGVWFVEYRRTAFRRRRRNLEETGNWKGILREVLDDLIGERDERKTEQEVIE